MESANSHSAKQDEIDQMQQELGRMEHSLLERYCEVGKSLLETAEQECRKINRLVDEIIEAQQKLAQAKQDQYCLQCAECNDQDSLYCKRCGYKFEIEKEHRA